MEQRKLSALNGDENMKCPYCEKIRKRLTEKIKKLKEENKALKKELEYYETNYDPY
jgi:glutaredoxin